MDRIKQDKQIKQVKQIKPKKKIELRPTFYFENDKKNEIRAGGAIFYKIDKEDNDILFLMIYSRDKYEDFGGKTDSIDANANDTIAREVDEESNGIFIKKNILKRINKLTPIYTNSSKYLLHFIELTKEEESIDLAAFGAIEIHDNIDRTVEYVSLNKFRDKNFVKDKLCFRLKFRSFFQFIHQLKITHFGNEPISKKFDKASDADESDKELVEKSK